MKINNRFSSCGKTVEPLDSHGYCRLLSGMYQFPCCINRNTEDYNISHIRLAMRFNLEFMMLYFPRMLLEDVGSATISMYQKQYFNRTTRITIVF